MRRYHYGYGWHISRRALFRLLRTLGLLLLVALMIVAMLQMRALLSRIATTKVSNTVNRIVTESVNQAIDDGDFTYEHLISFEKDNEGKITAVKSNMPEFNRLQSKILDRVLERISDVSTRDLSIPLGSLTGSTLKNPDRKSTRLNSSHT